MPKTIDNDVYGTEQTFGFHSAVEIATDAIDRLHTTANAHKRIMVIELMGHNAGWLTLYAGVAGGGDVILIPEIPYDLELIAEYLRDRQEKGKNSSIIVVAEGINSKKGVSAGHHIATKLSKLVEEQMRETVLGYIQRGGKPSPFDRILATRFGAYAAHLIAEGNYGQMVALQNGHVTSIPIEDTEGKLSLVPKDHPLIKRAMDIGTCFGMSLG